MLSSTHLYEFWHWYKDICQIVLLLVVLSIYHKTSFMAKLLQRKIFLITKIFIKFVKLKRKVNEDVSKRKSCWNDTRMCWWFAIVFPQTKQMFHNVMWTWYYIFDTLDLISFLQQLIANLKKFVKLDRIPDWRIVMANCVINIKAQFPT